MPWLLLPLALALRKLLLLLLLRAALKFCFPADAVVSGWEGPHAPGCRWLPQIHRGHDTRSTWQSAAAVATRRLSWAARQRSRLEQGTASHSCASAGAEREGAHLGVGELVDAAAGLDGEVAPHLGGAAEGQLVDQPAGGLEAVVGVLGGDAAGHHVPCKRGTPNLFACTASATGSSSRGTAAFSRECIRIHSGKAQVSPAGVRLHLRYDIKRNHMGQGEQA